MLFTSYDFLGFAAALLLIYYIIPKRTQWLLLLAASYIFYYIAGPEYLLYILTTTTTVFLTTLLIEKIDTRQKTYLKEHKEELTKEEKKLFKDKQKRKKLFPFVVCILINLGILAVVKYADFFISNINGIIKSTGSGQGLSFLSLAVPLGISFYTFQSIGYLVDVYRGTVAPQRNFFKFALFVSFFPQLVQGPIGRYGELSQTLYSPHRFDTKTVSYGLQRVLWGYFKKLVIADRVLIAVSKMIGEPSRYNGAYSLVIMLLYTLQLYADFTGGIDITIGLSEALGIRMSENFNLPYFSKSLKEYWRRWHISMCSWFRDYLFYPVSVSKPMQKLTKFSKKHFGNKIGKRLPVYLSTGIVWFSTGIWHGASWNFIVWGMSNWAILMISEEFEPLYKKFHDKFTFGNHFLYKTFQIIRTFALVCALNLFDCYSSISETARVFFSMFSANNWQILWNGALLELGLNSLDYIIILLGVGIMLTVSLLKRRESVRDIISRRPYPIRFIVWYGLFLVILLMGAYGIGYDASQFIYNQF